MGPLGAAGAGILEDHPIWQVVNGQKTPSNGTTMDNLRGGFGTIPG